jgi:hypothetical protein
VEDNGGHVEKILKRISPIPDASKWGLQSRKRKAERSEILTATPYKNKLQEKKERTTEKEMKKHSKYRRKIDFTQL